LNQEHARSGPGRAGYWIALVLFILGLIGSGILIALFVFGILGLGDDLNRIVAPGSEEVELTDSGSYTVFYEYESRVGSTYYSTDEDPPNMDVYVEHVDGDEEVTVRVSRGDTSYNVSDYSGISVRSFYIEEPGTYEITVSYADGSQDPPFVIAYGEGISRGILTTVGSFFAAGLVFCMFTVIAIALVGITFFRRYQSQRPQST
jgi:hypothetical protein